jgi:RNA polymerase sigma-B factor
MAQLDPHLLPVGRPNVSPGVPADGLADTHRRYAATRDQALRAELVRCYANLVRATAKRFEGRGEALEDLQQIAFVGFLEALDRFDPARGSGFVSYAVPTMVGHLKRHFRDRRWRVHVPRTVQERYLDIRSTRDELVQELGRVPSLPDIAAAVGLEADQVAEALAAGNTFAMASLENLAYGSDGAAWSGRAEVGYREVEDRLYLQSLVSRLPEQQRHVLRLRFAGELTQAEIGRRIGVSQMQISRLLARSLGTLRSLSAAGIDEGGLRNQDLRNGPCRHERSRRWSESTHEECDDRV